MRFLKISLMTSGSVVPNLVRRSSQQEEVWSPSQLRLRLEAAARHFNMTPLSERPLRLPPFILIEDDTLLDGETLLLGISRTFLSMDTA